MAYSMGPADSSPIEQICDRLTDLADKIADAQIFESVREQIRQSIAMLRRIDSAAADDVAKIFDRALSVANPYQQTFLPDLAGTIRGAVTAARIDGPTRFASSPQVVVQQTAHASAAATINAAWASLERLATGEALPAEAKAAIQELIEAKQSGADKATLMEKLRSLLGFARTRPLWHQH